MYKVGGMIMLKSSWRVHRSYGGVLLATISTTLLCTMDSSVAVLLAVCMTSIYVYAAMVSSLRGTTTSMYLLMYSIPHSTRHG